MAGSRLVLPSQQPIQSTGLPYPGGQLFFYISGTTTPANTYQDAALTTPNSNPVILDSAGDAGNVFLDQSIVYKIVLEDATGALVWTFDPVFPFASSTLQGVPYAGVTTGSANTQFLSGLPAPFDGQTITFTAGYGNTQSATLNTGVGNVFFYQQGAGPQLLGGGEIQVGVRYAASYNAALNSNAGGWQLIGAVSALGIGGNSVLAPFYQATTLQEAYGALSGYVPPAAGRLTLTTATPVLGGPVLGATSVLFTPFNGNQTPIWNAPTSNWSIATFAELSCLLSDATLSPAAAVAASLYDMFVWSHSGTLVLSRGPAWTNATTRALALATVGGVLTNSTSITNGPAANVGLYVGTIATDPAAATVSFNPNPAAAAGGPTGGAWVGLWNQYNRASVLPSAQDSNVSWTYATNTWHAADASNNNRITFVTGQASDYFSSVYMDYVEAPNNANFGFVGVGLDSTTVPQIFGGVGSPDSGAGAKATVSPNFVGAPVLGQHYVQALEISTIGTTTFFGNGQMQLSASLKF